MAESHAGVVRQIDRRRLPRFEEMAYRAIVHSVPHAVLLLDRKQQVLLANRAAALLFRKSPARLCHLPIAQIVPDAPLNVLLGNLGTRRVNVIETALTSLGRNHPARTLKITAVRLAEWHHGSNSRRAGNGAVTTGVTLLVLEDISDKALLEQQLLDTEKQAAMGQLAAGILHEVANPLTSLGSNLLFARSRLEPSADAEITQALDASLDQLDHMRQLLGTLCGLRRRAAPRYERADVHEILRRSVTFIARDAEERRISINLSFAPSAAVCEIDVRSITQVFLNLLKNAMEAMPSGGRIDVETSHRPLPNGDPVFVVIEIADNGVGIPESDLRRAFRPLFSTKRQGAGLGLSFCRQTVEEHGGELRLMSPGKDHGATAVIALPVRQPRQQG